MYHISLIHSSVDENNNCGSPLPSAGNSVQCPVMPPLRKMGAVFINYGSSCSALVETHFDSSKVPGWSLGNPDENEV